MGRIPDAFIREVLDRSDLSELIGRHVKLKKSGASYKGLCPFHGEKSPSFYVHPAKQYYHCFGCSAHGNAIDFLMNYEQLPFIEALERLAQTAGMEVPRSEQVDREHQRRSYINDRFAIIQNFFTEQLSKMHEALSYLTKERGLSPEIIKHFGLGYAPNAGNLLPNLFANKEKALLTETGLLSSYQGREYARFRHRITFPVRDERGRLIAFGARSLRADQKPKYLNTVFDKHLYLYGLYEAIAAKHPSKILIVVEGYLDVLMLAQHGLTNAVAGLGTAIGVKQVKLLFRYSQKIVFCFDGDKAGYAAAEKALKSVLQVLSDGVEVKFVFLSDGEDPDSVLRKHGKKALMDAFAGGLTLEGFFFEALRRHFPAESMAQLASRGKLGLSWLEGMPNSLMKHLLKQRLAKWLEVDEAALEELAHTKEAKAQPEQEAVELKTLSPLQYLLSKLLQNPVAAAKCVIPDWLRGAEQRDCALIVHAIEYSISSSSESVGALVEHWRDQADDAYIKQLAYWQHLSDETNWDDAFKQAELFWITHRIELLLSKARNDSLDNSESEQLVVWMKRKNQLKSSKS